MMIRRYALVGLAVLASVSLATAGCGVPVLVPTTGKSKTPSVQPERPARQVLADSTAETRKSTYKFTMKVGETTGEGSADPAAKSGNINLELIIPEVRLKSTFQVLTLNFSSWVKIDWGRAANLPDTPKLPKQWMSIEPSKVEDPNNLGFREVDPLDAGEVFNAIVEVRRTGERHYEGTVDLRDATKSFLVDNDHVKALGDGAVSVPFGATVDDKGRLTSVEIKVPSAGDFAATTWKGAYLDYGVAVTFARPNAGEVVEAPAAVYKILNS